MLCSTTCRLSTISKDLESHCGVRQSGSALRYCWPTDLNSARQCSLAIFLTDLYVHAVSRDMASIVVTAAILASGYAALAWLLQHRLGFDLKRAHLKDVIILLVAVPSGIIVTSVTYCASLYLMGYLPGSLFWSGVQRLWIGDTIGTVIVVPAIMAGIMAVNRGSHVRVDAAIVDVGTFLLGLAVAFWMIFRPSKTNEFQFFYLLFLPVIWIAIRAGFEGAAFAIFVLHVALVAITKLEGYHCRRLYGVSAGHVGFGSHRAAAWRHGDRASRDGRAPARAASRPFTNVSICDGGGNGRFVGPPNKSAIVNYRNLLACCAPSIPIGSSPDPAAVADALDKAQTEARRAREVLERLKDFLSAWQDGACAHRLDRVGVKDHPACPPRKQRCKACKLELKALGPLSFEPIRFRSNRCC